MPGCYYAARHIDLVIDFASWYVNVPLGLSPEVFTQRPPQLHWRWQNITCFTTIESIFFLSTASVYPPSLLQLVWQILWSPAGDAPMLQPVVLFVFCFIQRYQRSDQDLCSPVVFSFAHAAVHCSSASFRLSCHYNTSYFWLLLASSFALLNSLLELKVLYL